MHRELRELVEPAVKAVCSFSQTSRRIFSASSMPGSPLAEVGAVDLVLQRPPAQPDPERNTPVRQLVDGGDLLGDPYRVVDRQLEDAGADAQVWCVPPPGEEGQRDPPVAGHEVVVADGGRVEAGLLRLLREGERLGRTGRAPAVPQRRKRPEFFIVQSRTRRRSA